MSTEMTHDQYMSDASEIATLEHLLRGIPDERAIERIGLQSRLKRIRKRLDGVPIPPQPKQLYISFDGPPLVGSYRIDADFAADAITIFTKTIRIATAGLTGEIKDSGRVPKSPLSQTIITGVDSNSFGFQMEFPLPEPDPYGFSYPEEAYKLLLELLTVTKNGDDDALSIATTHLHTRAVNQVAELLDFMRKRGTHFAMHYRATVVRFDTDTEIEEAIKRLAPSNTQIQTNDVVGTMIQVIPQTRSFHLHTNDGDSIHGRIGSEIREPYQIADQHTNQQVRAQIRTARIRRGAPSHSLVRVSQELNPPVV